MSALVYEARLALTALQLMTRLPVPRWTGYSPAQLGESARYFPFAGAVVGAVSALAFIAAREVLPSPVAVALSMLAGILVTGGFHEDGLADSCDGFGGGRNASEVLEIMKDSRSGSYAIIGLVMALLLKFASLSALPAAAFAVAVIAAHAFSRFMAVSVMYTQTYVRDYDDAKVRLPAERMTAGSLLWASLWAVAPVAALGIAGGFAALAAGAARLAAGWYFQRRIGGYTGDCLGAVQQVTEISFYLGLLVWISI